MANLPKFIIDTDPGKDDALAILTSLESQKKNEIEILAITLVAGNTAVENQSENVLRILNLVPECFGKVRIQCFVLRFCCQITMFPFVWSIQTLKKCHF
jgi:hypothetical protein